MTASGKPKGGVRLTHALLGGQLVVSLLITAAAASGVGIEGIPIAADAATLLPFNPQRVLEKVADLRELDSRTIVYAAAFSPDGTVLALSSGYSAINIWDWQHGRVVATVQTPRGFDIAQATNRIAFSPDGTLLVTCGSQGVGHVFLRVWNTSAWLVTKDIVDNGPGGCKGVTFSPDGKLLIWVADRESDRGDNLFAENVSDWSRAWSLALDSTPEAIAITQKGDLLAIASYTFRVPAKIKDPYERSRQTRIQPVISFLDPATRTVIRTFDTVAGSVAGTVALSPDGSRLAIAGATYVEIRDVATGKQLLQVKVEGQGNPGIGFTFDGRYLIETDANGIGRGIGNYVWNDTRTRRLAHISDDTASLALSPDSKYVAFGGFGHTTVWKIK